MGFSDYAGLSQWSNGQYPYSTNVEDDIAILGLQLGLREDEAGDTPGTAGTVTMTTATQFTASGVISARDDVDLWEVTLGDSGGIDVQATPWYSSEGTAGNNLDIQLTLFGSDGSRVATQDPADITSASVFVDSLAAGTYYVGVEGSGDPRVINSDYGSLGQYKLTGELVDDSVTFGTMRPAFVSSCAADANEDNNDPEVATVLSDGTRQNGASAGTVVLTNTVSGNVCNEQDVDFFAIPTCANGAIDVTVYFDHDDGDIDLLIFDEDGSVIDGGTSVSDNEVVSHTRDSSSGGNHIASVFVYGSSSSNVAYTLVSQVTCDSDDIADCDADSHEPNDAGAAATVLSDLDSTVRGTLCDGDVDVFRVTVCPVALLDASFTLASLGVGSASLEVTITSLDGVQLEQATISGTQGVVSASTDLSGLDGGAVLISLSSSTELEYAIDIDRECVSGTTTAAPFTTTAMSSANIPAAFDFLAILSVLAAVLLL